MADYADTPWWSNLLAVLITLVVSVVGTIYFMRNGAPSATGNLGAAGIANFFKDTLVYMPHALLLYGVIADMLTNEGVYSIASFIGLFIVLPVHFLFKYIWQGTFDVFEKVRDAIVSPTTTGSRIDASSRVGKASVISTSATGTAPAKPSNPKSPFTPGSTQMFGGAEPGSFFGTYTGCDLQGMGWAHSPYAPQTLVIIATIFSYYGIDLINNRGAKNAATTIGLGIVFYLTQLFLSGNCAAAGEPMVSKFYQAILAAAEGLFIGGVSYSVVQAYYPQRLPSSTISPFPRLTPNMLKDGKFDKDGNPWVCVGGVCYPDMSSAESRKAFAGMVAESTGNGRAAVSEDCAAT